MRLVVDQIVDELAGEQNAEAYPAQTLLFTHEGVAEGIVIRVIDCRVVQAGRVEAVVRKLNLSINPLLYCYHYGPATGKYGAVVINMVRLGGSATLMAMIALIFLLRRYRAAQVRLSASRTL